MEQNVVNICGGFFIIILIVLAVLEISKAPYGYEDETGFHEGKPK